MTSASPDSGEYGGRSIITAKVPSEKDRGERREQVHSEPFQGHLVGKMASLFSDSRENVLS